MTKGREGALPWWPIVAAAVAITACSTPTAPIPLPTPSPTPTAMATPQSSTPTIVAATPTAPVPSPKPTPETILRTAEVAGWEQLDPHATASSAFFHFFGNVYSGLVRWETLPSTKAEVRRVVPDLAESWEQVDGSTYRFHLRPGARWHDLPPLDGRPITAEDAVFSVSRLALRSAHTTLWTRFASARAIAPDVVEIVLTEPYSPFLSQLASGANGLVAPEAVAAGGGSLREGPVVGTGPFLFDAAASDRRSIGVFRRHGRFYEEGVPGVDRLERLVVGTEEARAVLLRTGRIDFAITDASTAQSAVERGPASLRAVGWPSPEAWSLTFSPRPPFDRVEVRRAFSLAMDRVALWQAFSRTQLPLMAGLGMPLPSEEASLPDEEIAGFHVRDLAEAQRLLQSAGVPPRMPVIVTMGDYGAREVDAELALVRQLRELGLNAEAEVVRPGEYAARTLPPGNFQVAFGPVAAPEEGDLWLGARFESGGALNIGGIADPELDRLIQAQRREADPDLRATLIRDIQRRLLVQAYQPTAFLEQRWVVWRQGVEGWPAFVDEPYQRFLRGVRVGVPSG